MLIVAAHHCREIVTPEMALGAIRMLLDPAHREEVAAFQTWVIPVVNVDGYNYVFETEPMWRKNRRVLPSGDVGVDLNRNYLMGCALCALHRMPFRVLGSIGWNIDSIP